MNTTDEQLAAIQTTDRALLVDAGAGTGKTWVLVERFLHLLRQNPAGPLESIIAITFTEKATREMRSRIRRAVEHAAAEESRSASLARTISQASTSEKEAATSDLAAKGLDFPPPVLTGPTTGKSMRRTGTIHGPIKWNGSSLS